MAHTVRIILFTSNESMLPELRRTITTLPQVRIVAELDEPSLLSQAVAQFPADIVVADLDPYAPVVIECIKQLKESNSGLTVIAMSQQTEGQIVLAAMRAGIEEYLIKPLNVEEFTQAVTRLAGSSPRTREPGKLISVMGSSGGVGCTAISTNLGVELTELVGDQKKVALVDLDFRFGHVATLLDVHGQFTVADLCATPEELDPDIVMKALVRHPSGLYVLRRPHSFAQAEMITSAHCANVLAALQEMCAYVVVDGPTRHDPGGRSVLDAADHCLLILQLLVPSVRNTDRMIQELAVQGFNTERIQFVCNRLGRESALLEVDQVETILNRKIFQTIADDWKAVNSSINIGQPLKVDFDRSRVRLDIRELAMRIHCPEKIEAHHDRKGIFGKLFHKPAAAVASVVTAVKNPPVAAE